MVLLINNILKETVIPFSRKENKARIGIDSIFPRQVVGISINSLRDKKTK